MVFIKKYYICLAMLFTGSLFCTLPKHALPEPDQIIPESNARSNVKKPWTMLVFVAADNNLRDFAALNLKQMATIGSNNFINILVHIDIRLLGSKKTTRRYFIEKNKITQIDLDTEKNPMDSGDPETLISAARWAFENYPADHHALVLWNHGTGIIDPYGKRLLNTDDLFFYNPDTQKYELDRTIGFLELIDVINDPRGMCWDDSKGNYLTNQKMDYAFNYIVTHFLKGKKLDIIGFDACLMSMLEVAQITKSYSHIQVSSQEVELGPGWNYHLVLSPFDTRALTREEFAQHIVQSFANAYQKITNDYTQAALNLETVNLLENNINSVGQQLSTLLETQDAPILKNIIANARSKKSCTHFDEPSYLDLHHLYTNLVTDLKNEPRFAQLPIIGLLEEGRALIKQVVLAYVTGPNLSQAKGISIYFPEKRIHPSYKKSGFGITNKWSTFLTNYLLA